MFLVISSFTTSSDKEDMITNPQQQQFSPGTVPSATTILNSSVSNTNHHHHNYPVMAILILSTEPPPAFKEPDASVSNQHLYHILNSQKLIPCTRSLISNLYLHQKWTTLKAFAPVKVELSHQHPSYQPHPYMYTIHSANKMHATTTQNDI